MQKQCMVCPEYTSYGMGRDKYLRTENSFPSVSCEKNPCARPMGAGQAGLLRAGGMDDEKAGAACGAGCIGSTVPGSRKDGRATHLGGLERRLWEDSGGRSRQLPAPCPYPLFAVRRDRDVQSRV